MGILKWLAITVLVLVVGIAALVFGMRFADGPWGIVAGGAFTTGTTHSGPEPDWAFLRDTAEVQFQLENPARSRTTWVLEHEGRIFIPCGYMNSAWGRMWKQWPIEAERNGATLLRVGDVIYERTLVRIKDDPIVAPLVAELARKYVPGVTEAMVQDNSLWLFELAPRAQHGGAS